MPSIANDGTLTRGSIDLTISAVVYTLINYKRSRGKARTTLDYTSAGKPSAATHAEDFETISGTIRVRSDKVAPPKFTVFTYDSKNWYLTDREESGSTEGIKEYAVEILECINAAVTVT